MPRPETWSDQLRRVHQGLIDRLEDARDDLTAGGRPDVEGLAACPGCPLLCATVSTHHTREDDGLFALLEGPELAETLDRLRQDHRAVAGLVADLDAASASDEGTDALVARLDGLAAILTSHFRFEERALGPALDGLGASSATSSRDADRLFGDGGTAS